MATITERLAFLISADATGAIRAFDKTAASAEKQMTKATKSIDAVAAGMTRFGAIGLAAAGTLGAGLFKLAQGAIDDQRAQELLAEQIRNSTDATNGQIAATEQMIDATARATGVADDQLRPAMGNLVRATGDLTRAQDLLQLSLDVSAATGRDLETVTIAIGKAANGNVTALSRMGIPLDENVKKAKDANAALAALATQTAGASATAAETYAGKLERTKVALSEAGEEVGNAFIPIIKTGADVVNNAVGAFNAFNTTTGGLAGQLAAVGTVGIAAVSALSMIGGQAIKLRASLFNVDAATGKLTGGLTGLGKAVGVVGIGIGAATIAYGFYAKAKEKAAQQTKNLEEALKLEAESNQENLKELIKTDPNLRRYILQLDKLGLSLNDVREYIESNTGKFKEYADVLTGQVTPGSAKYDKVMRDIAVALTGTDQVTSELATETAFLGRNTEKLVKILQDEAEANRVAQLAIENNTDAKEKQNTSTRLLAYQLQQMKDAMDKATKANEENKRIAEEATAEQQRQADEAARTAAALAQLRTEIAGNFTNALKNAKGVLLEKRQAMADYAATVADAITSQFSFADALNATTKSGEDYTAAQQAVNSANKDVVAAERAVRDAASDVIAARVKFGEVARDNKSSSEDIRKASEDLTLAQEKEKDATDALNVAKGNLTKANSTLATAQGEATKTFMDRLQEQADGAAAFGAKVQALLAKNISPAALQQIISAGAEVGGKIADELLSGADSQIKVDKANALVQSLQDSAKLIGDDAATKNEFYTAGVKQAESLVSGVESVIKKYRVKLKSKNLSEKQLKRLQDKFEVAVDFEYVTREFEAPSLADGGVVKARSGGTLVRVAEAGYDEAVIPLNRAGMNGSVFNITVNAGMGADGTQIGRFLVDELVAYQRRVGALPIKVSN